MNQFILVKYEYGLEVIDVNLTIKWRPPSLSELTPMVFNMGLTHFGSEASKSLNRFTSRK